MLDSRQRDELNELVKYLSTRIAWLRIGLFVSSLVQFATNVSTRPDTPNQCLFRDASTCAWGKLSGGLTFVHASVSIIGDFFYGDIKSVLRRRLVSQMEMYVNALLGFVNFVVAWMLQSGWRSWPVGSYEVHALHSSSAHTIIVFTFFNAAFLTALFYMSVMAYNEGHYYLYHRVQQGVTHAFDTEPIMANCFDANDDEASQQHNQLGDDYLPRPFSPGFGQLTIDEA